MPVEITDEDLEENPFSPSKMAGTFQNLGIDLPDNLINKDDYFVSDDTDEVETEETTEETVEQPETGIDGELETEEGTENAEQASLIGTVFKTPQELERAYKELQALQTRASQEAADLRRQVQAGSNKTTDTTTDENRPGFKNAGQILGKTGDEQVLAIERGDYGKDPKTGAPYDELGVPFYPSWYWESDKGRFSDYVANFRERYKEDPEPEDITQMRLIVAKERSDWQSRYGYDRQLASLDIENKRRSVDMQDEISARANIKKADEEVLPALRKAQVSNLLATMPQGSAEKVVDAILERVSKRVAGDYSSGRMTKTSATDPERVKQLFGAELARSIVDGSFAKIVKSAIEVTPPKSNAGGGTSSSTTNGVVATRGKGVSSSNGQVKVTRDDVAMAKAFGKTPKEIAEMRSKNELF